MATRIRARSASVGGSDAASGAQQSTSGAKRRRDVLQDISEEHAVNGESVPQKLQASAGSSRRASLPANIPMAPARRVSVRRSRRLSEQQPAASGRVGASRVATSSTGSSGGSGTSGVPGFRDSEGEDHAGMSCDEDLEGTIVDLSFEGVTDCPSTSSLWRDSGRRSSRQDGEHSRDIEGGGGKPMAKEWGGEGGQSGKTGSESTYARREVDRKGSRVRDRSSSGRGRDAVRLVSVGGMERKTDATTRGGSGGSDVATQLSTDETDALSGAGGGLQVQDRAEGGNLSSVADEDSETSQPSQKLLRAPREDIECEADRKLFSDASVRTPLPVGVEDIDAGVWDEGESHLLNPDYVVEHAAFLRVQEKKNRPGAYIGSRQKDMRSSMRSVLVDWIVEVCDQFKLSPRTLFQTVELIDRSLTTFEVPRGKLQLLGCACVVLASKYEEIYAPTAEELAHISDNTYTRAEIISMELKVVNSLQFRVMCTTPFNFVDRFCRAAGSKARERSLVAYFLELLLQDYYGVTLLPSLKAAAALYLARQTLHPKGSSREAWTKQVEYYTGYSSSDLEPCVRRLYALHLRAEGNNLHAVRTKYKKPLWHRVAEATCALEENLHFGGEGSV